MVPSMVFLPVDERFCTRDYFLLLSEAAGIRVKTPPKKRLGQKKIPADTDGIRKWLESEIEEGDILVLSLDMLLHGGLIPSRTSLDSMDTIEERIAQIAALKKKNTKIYMSATVTRAPFYDSAEEEPDYWEYFGKMTYDFTRAVVRFRNGTGDPKEVKEAAAEIPTWAIDDFLTRRARNFKIVRRAIELVGNGTVDYLNLTLDDNSSESLSLFEAEKHMERIEKLGLQDRISVHPGADESTLTLLSKSLCDLFGISPEFEIAYTEPDFKRFVPAYEGSPFEESLSNHIEAAGGRIADSGGDILLVAHNPVDKTESPFQPTEAEDGRAYRLFEEHSKGGKKVVGVADGRYTNGADNRLVERLLEKRRDWSSTNYAGWNTVGNTVGTVCAVSAVQHMGRAGLLDIDAGKMRKLNAVFLLEHWGFQANARQTLVKKVMEKGLKMWTVMPVERFAVDFTREELLPYLGKIEEAFGESWERFGVYFPWHRSFELGVDLR